MAKFRVVDIEARADAKVACDVYVLTEQVIDGEETDREVGHFTVILNAETVNSCDGTKLQRVKAYKELFAADKRIAGILDSEDAVAKMKADVTFPITVAL